MFCVLGNTCVQGGDIERVNAKYITFKYDTLHSAKKEAFIFQIGLPAKASL
jgi:hypothetical protein